MSEKERYKREIVRMVEGIEDEWILHQIRKFILNMTKEGD